MIDPAQFEVWRYIYTLVGIIFILSVSGLMLALYEYIKKERIKKKYK